jgi:hypothetical protein
MTENPDNSVDWDRLPLGEAIRALRKSYADLHQLITDTIPEEDREAFRRDVEAILAESKAGAAGLDELEAGLLGLEPPAGSA